MAVISHLRANEQTPPRPSTPSNMIAACKQRGAVLSVSYDGRRRPQCLGNEAGKRKIRDKGNPQRPPAVRTRWVFWRNKNLACVTEVKAAEQRAT